MSGPIKSCPHCGYEDSYSFRAYGVIISVNGIFGQGEESQEVVEVITTRDPIYAFCCNCKKRIKLSLLRKKYGE